MKNLHKHRNIGISAHIDSGKTTLTERILYYSGRIHRMREIKGGDGGATMDFMELEKERGITITSAATRVEWQGHAINVIDTPGHVDFTVEVERSLRVLDGAVLVLCAVGGVQSQSLTVDRQMKRYHVPRIAFINKMDRTGADSDNVIRQIQEKLGVTPLPLQLPIWEETEFVGMIDLIEMQAIYFDGDRGEDVRRIDIPDHLKEQAEAGRTHLLETVSLHNDEVLELLLSEEEVPVDLVKKVIREATLTQQLTPVLMGTAYRNKGVQELLDAVIDFLPSPLDREIKAMDVSKKDVDKNSPEAQVILSPTADAPMVAMAFKTVVEQFGQLTYMRVYQGMLKKGESYRNIRTGQTMRVGRLLRMHADQREDLDEAGPGDIVAAVGIDCASGDTFCGQNAQYALESIFVPEAVMRLSIEPLTNDGADRMNKALQRFRREDPTFRVETDPETEETLIAGMGQLHLEIYVERMRREYKVECIVGEPKVAYRECPTVPVEFNFKHKKQTGGSGQYAHIVGKIVPLPEDAPQTYEFVNNVTQGRIPREYIPAVDEGFQQTLVKGPLCGCEVVGVQAILEDGSYHDVDSSEMAFKICGNSCMRDNFKRAQMVLLEPIMKLEAEVPENFQGTICGHLSSKRGLITGTHTIQGTSVIVAEIPLAEMFDYATELRSMTQGQGTFTLEFVKNKQVPRNIQEQVIARRRENKKELVSG